MLFGSYTMAEILIVLYMSYFPKAKTCTLTVST